MYLQRMINLQPHRPNVRVQLEETYIVNLKVGDVLFDLKQEYHGIVRESRGEGMFVVHWYKWDPTIEMPMLQYLFSPGQVFRVVNPTPDLDLKELECGGPYN